MPLTRRDFVKSMYAGAGAAALALGRGLAAAEPQPAGGRVQFPVRECYCPAHFGNSYEAMWPREMAAYLAELKWMGFNRYGDWITTTDVCNPYTSDATWDLAKEQLDRKKKAFRAAQELGLGLNLIVTPNHVYLDQLRPHYAAKKARGIFGQIICPSNPEARKLILENFERWFADFADSRLRLSTLTAFAYDYGGCACEKCSPWILTFGRLMKEVHALALRRHPDIEPWCCSWWWKPEEHAQFNEWAAKEAPGWLKGMTLHIEYGQTRFKEVPLPAGCRTMAFVHIGYPDGNQTRDTYAKWGPVIAPRRIPETLANLAQLGADGFQAYSEGMFDDCNKMLLAGIGSGRFRDADEALRSYAQRYFAASPERAAEWARWLAAWGNRTTAPLPAAAEQLDRLAEGVRPTWRLEHWRSKVELETIDRAIGRPADNEWTPEKLALADKFWAAQERMFREVYRLGPVRHVLNPRFHTPFWFESWQKAVGSAPKERKIQPEA